MEHLKKHLDDIESVYGEVPDGTWPATLEVSEGEIHEGLLAVYPAKLRLLVEGDDLPTLHEWNYSDLGEVKSFADLEGHTVAVQTAAGLVEIKSLPSEEEARILQQRLFPPATPAPRSAAQPSQAGRAKGLLALSAFVLVLGAGLAMFVLKPADQVDDDPILPKEVQAEPDTSSYALILRRATTYFRNGQPETAQAEFSRAVKLNPRGVAAWIGLANVHFELDQNDQALAAAKKAVGIDPGNARAQITLATICQTMGKRQRAVQAYRAYLTLEPKGRFAKDVREILKHLDK